MDRREELIQRIDDLKRPKELSFAEISDWIEDADTLIDDIYDFLLILPDITADAEEGE